MLYEVITDIPPELREGAAIALPGGLRESAVRRRLADLADVSAGKTYRKYVFSQFQSGNRGIYMAVCNDWKYVYSAGDGQEFLFDRKTSLPDTHDVAGMQMVNNIQAEIRNDLLEYP